MKTVEAYCVKLNDINRSSHAEACVRSNDMNLRSSTSNDIRKIYPYLSKTQHDSIRTKVGRAIRNIGEIMVETLFEPYHENLIALSQIKDLKIKELEISKINKAIDEKDNIKGLENLIYAIQSARGSFTVKLQEDTKKKQMAFTKLIERKSRNVNRTNSKNSKIKPRKYFKDHSNKAEKNYEEGEEGVVGTEDNEDDNDDYNEGGFIAFDTFLEKLHKMASSSSLLSVSLDLQTMGRKQIEAFIKGLIDLKLNVPEIDCDISIEKLLCIGRIRKIRVNADVFEKVSFPFETTCTMSILYTLVAIHDMFDYYKRFRKLLTWETYFQKYDDLATKIPSKQFGILLELWKKSLEDRLKCDDFRTTYPELYTFAEKNVYNDFLLMVILWNNANDSIEFFPNFDNMDYWYLWLVLKLVDTKTYTDKAGKIIPFGDIYHVPDYILVPINSSEYEIKDYSPGDIENKDSFYDLFKKSYSNYGTIRFIVMDHTKFQPIVFKELRLREQLNSELMEQNKLLIMKIKQLLRKVEISDINSEVFKNINYSYDNLSASSSAIISCTTSSSNIILPVFNGSPPAKVASTTSSSSIILPVFNGSPPAKVASTTSSGAGITSLIKSGISWILSPSNKSNTSYDSNPESNSSTELTSISPEQFYDSLASLEITSGNYQLSFDYTKHHWMHQICILSTCKYIVEYSIKKKISNDEIMASVGEYCFDKLYVDLSIPLQKQRYQDTPPNGYCAYLLQMQMWKHYKDGEAFTSAMPPIDPHFPYTAEFIDAMKNEEKRLKDQLKQEMTNEIIRNELTALLSRLSPAIHAAEKGNQTPTIPCNLPFEFWGLHKILYKFFFNGHQYLYPRIMFSNINGRLFLYDARLEGEDYSIINHSTDTNGYTMKNLEDVFSGKTHYLTGCLSGKHYYPITLSDNFEQILESIKSIYQNFIHSLVKILSKVSKDTDFPELLSNRMFVKVDDPVTKTTTSTEMMDLTMMDSPTTNMATNDEPVLKYLNDCIATVDCIINVAG